MTDIEVHLAHVGRQNDHAVRLRAIEVLGGVIDPRVCEALQENLGDQNDEIAIAAAASLAKGRYTKELLAALKDEVLDPDVLISLLEHRNPRIRYSAADALGSFGASGALKALISCLYRATDTSDDEIYARVSAADALAKLEAFDILLQALDSSDDMVRRTVEDVLKEVDHPDIPNILLSALPIWNRRREYIGALCDLGWHPSTDRGWVYYMVGRRRPEELLNQWTRTSQVLMDDIRSQSRRRVYFAVFTFIGLGREEKIPQLISTLNDKDDLLIAEAFLNSHNKVLREAVERWAEIHGYEITVGRGSQPVGWGYL